MPTPEATTSDAGAPVERVTIDDPTTWYRRGDQEIHLADMVDSNSPGAAMTVGFARYGKGETNPWVLTYDEALVVTKGAFTVWTGDHATSAKAGQVLYLRAGAEVLYQADEDTELVMVTYPHWFDATASSVQSHRLDEFQPQ